MLKDLIKLVSIHSIRGDVYMKRTKKLSLSLIGLILIFTLMACSTDKDVNLEESQIETDHMQDGTQEVEEQDEIETVEEDFIEEGQPEDPLGEDIAIDPDIMMINQSDYIAKIKRIQKDSGGIDIKILENIKGSLSNENLPVVESLEINRVYLVFLKDEDGSIVLTDKNNSLVLLEGDNSEIFEKINREIHGN